MFLPDYSQEIIIGKKTLGIFTIHICKSCLQNTYYFILTKNCVKDAVLPRSLLLYICNKVYVYKYSRRRLKVFDPLQ